METLSQKPSKKERELAKGSAKAFEKASRVKSAGGVTEIRLQGAAGAVKVPQKAMRLFSAILNNMAEGQATKVVGADVRISTQQAAEYLYVSRPFIIKLLDNGELPYTMVGTHRRIALKDIELYAKKLDKTRRKGLKFLVEQAQELQMGYK